MTKAQTENQGSEIGFELIFQAGFGLPITNIVTEYIKKLQDAITEQHEKQIDCWRKTTNIFPQSGSAEL